MDRSGLHVWLVLWKAYESVRAHADRHIRGLGLGFSDFAVLELLLHKGPTPVNAIGQRVHLAVDYDTERDFSANNNIQVYYQGLEDEIIRRIEVGTVTFQPPQSRFITAAIPANNFGVNARFEVGPLQFQTLAATQKGSQVAERVYTIGQTTSQPQDRQLRDLDFETGRFFWVVDPTTAIPNYPAIDILNRQRSDAAALTQAARKRAEGAGATQEKSSTYKEARIKQQAADGLRRPDQTQAAVDGGCSVRHTRAAPRSRRPRRA